MAAPVRYLIVEDNKDDAELILHALRRGGHDPQYEIVSTRDALAAALKRGPWGIVLSDYNLGSFTGLDALRMLQASGIDIPFILISGTLGEERAVECIRLGVTDYLLKGNLRRLVPAVEQALQVAEARHATREAEASSIRSRELALLLLNNAADLVAVTDSAGVPSLVSASSQEFLGIPPEDLTGASLATLVHPGDMAEWRRLHGAVLAEPGFKMSVEFRMRRRDGSWSWFECSAKNLMNVPGVAGVLLNLRTIEARRMAEAERDRLMQELRLERESLADQVASRTRELSDTNSRLRESKELVTLITQTIPGIVFRREIKADGSPSYAYFAGQLLEAFQITEQDALQNPAKLFDLIHPDDRAPMIQSLDPAAEDLSPRTFVIRLINPAGGTRWIEIQSRAEQKPDGRIFRNGIMVDVTERKEAEAALEASERRYRAVINNAPGVVFQQRKSREGMVSFTFFSEQLQAVMGITPSEALTHPSRFDALFHPEELEIRKRYLKESAANMSLREVDLRFMHPDGTYHWLHTRAIPHREPDGSILWDGLAHDITDRHILEDSLRHAERLQAIAQLSDGVAHHFNNLLAIIAGNVELLALDSFPESGRKDLIAKIETAVSRGARVVDELREFSKYDVSQSGAVSVHKLLQQMHNLAMPATGSGIQLQLEVASGLWGAAVDRSRLQTAMLNLLFNARDAMPRGGSVVVAARNLPLDAEAAGAMRLQPGMYIELSVKDNGVGMTQEVQEHALNPFFTTKETGQGVGLGLSMVHRFATQSGGAVSLQSTPGVGTEVRLLLPASPEAGRAA